MAISQDKWDKARTLFETGKFSLSEISKQTGINKSSISKKAKIQQWSSVENSDYIEAKVLISDKKSTLTVEKINTLDDVANEIIKHRHLFQTSALRNQQKANEILEMTEDMKDIESHARITKTNKETVLGKDPETVINNANVQENNMPMQINIIRDI